MGTNSRSNRTFQLAHIGLALQAFYLNLSLHQAEGDYMELRGPGPVGPGGGGWWGGAPLGFQGFQGLQGYQGYQDYGRGVGGFRNTNGYYDDLLANRNGWDAGKIYGGGLDYGRGSVVGGGYKDQGGRNRGHAAAGFSTSYRKDESGDKSTYYDDGLGHHNRLQYGAHDTRFRDLGGAARRGGFHDSNLNRNALANSGRYGESLGYRGHGGFTDGRGFAFDRGFRHGRVYQEPSIITFPPPPLKNSALYVIPTPDKLFFDPPPKV